MSRLLSLLKAAAGEISLSGALGRFLQAVAEEAASASEGLFNISVLTGVPVLFNAVGTIPLNTIASDGGINYDPATSIWTLKAGKLYNLEFFGSWESFGGTTDNVTVEWVNANSNAPLVNLGSAPSTVRPVTGTSNAASQPIARVLYRPTVDTPVKLRATQVNGSASLSLDSYAIVQQVGG